VKEACVFDLIPSFETPTDIGVDPFHDLLEGVCHSTMITILSHLQSLDSSFLENLNDDVFF